MAVSVPYFETLIFIFAVLFIFTFFSQTLYFNTLFLLFGYQFYYLTTKLLIEKGANINAINKEGKTALSYALANNRNEIIKLLRQAGATE